MKDKARRTLHAVIRTLDKNTQPRERGSWKAQAEEELRLGDDEISTRTYLYLCMIEVSQRGIDEAVVKTLVGENILTPSLTTKGWQLWRRPLLTKVEKRSVESAVIRWSEAYVSQVESLRGTIQGAQKDKVEARSTVLGMASVLDIASTCRQQLSADLKEVLGSAMSQ